MRLDRQMKIEHYGLWRAIRLDLICLGLMAIGFFLNPVQSAVEINLITDFIPLPIFGILLGVSWVILLIGFLREPKLFRWGLTIASGLLIWLAISVSWGVAEHWLDDGGGPTLGIITAPAIIFMAWQFHIQAFEPKRNPVSQSIREQESN